MRVAIIVPLTSGKYMYRKIEMQPTFVYQNPIYPESLYPKRGPKCEFYDATFACKCLLTLYIYVWNYGKHCPFWILYKPNLTVLKREIALSSSLHFWGYISKAKAVNFLSCSLLFYRSASRNWKMPWTQRGRPACGYVNSVILQK